MKKFIVNTAILTGMMDPVACAIGTPKMLEKQGIKNVKIQSCYCCGPEGTVVFIANAESKEVLLDALNKIDLPVASIMEVEEVKPSY